MKHFHDGVVPKGVTGQFSTVDRDRRPGGFLSPYLYYLTDAGVQQITETGPDGETRVLADGAFLEAINREE